MLARLPLRSFAILCFLLAPFATPAQERTPAPRGGSPRTAGAPSSRDSWLDGVVIVNAYHEMTKRIPVLTRQDQVRRHRLAIELARDDLEAQGFEIVRTDPKFIDYGAREHRQQQWLLVARRPAR